MGKRLSCALFLDVVKSGNFNIQSRDKATVDAHGMIYTLLLTYYYAFDYQRQLICHIGIIYNHRRGFLCVARS